MPTKTDAITVLIVTNAESPALRPDHLLPVHGMRGVVTSDIDSVPATVRTLQPHALLLDHWPDVTEAVALLHRIRAATQAPILVLAGETLEAERILVLEVGADEVISKPVSEREILARLRAHLRRYLAERDGLVPDCFAGWRALGKRRQVVTPFGEAVPLTAAEFDLLAALGEQPGTPLNRTTLAQRVLKRPWHHEDRSIDNLVYQVRRKLAAYGAEALLTTLRNQGYSSAIPLLED